MTALLKQLKNSDGVTRESVNMRLGQQIQRVNECTLTLQTATTCVQEFTLRVKGLGQPQLRRYNHLLNVFF